MIDPSSEILTAFYTALNGNLSYSSETWAVYTSVPKSDADKYVVLEELSVSDDNTKDSNHWDCSLTIEVVGGISIGQVSMKPVDSITSQILNALFKVDLSMPSFSMTVLPWFDDVSKYTDLVGSGILARKAIRVRFEVQEKSVAGLNAGESGGTDWMDTDVDGTPNLWSAVGSTISIVTGNGFTGNAIKSLGADSGDGIKITADADGGNVWEIGSDYQVTCKYRKFSGGSGPPYPNPLQINIKSSESQQALLVEEDNTDDATEVTSETITPDATDLIICFTDTANVGAYFEIDEITITEV